MKTGRPVEPAVEKWAGGRTEAFIGAMECLARRRAPILAEQVDLSDARRLLDVGGGPGTYSIEFCKRYPRLEATVFDLPQVVPIARKRIAEAGLAGRISAEAGDYQADPLGAGYDVALLFSILHSNGPDENRRLLSKTFRALNPGGRALILEFLVDDSKTRPAFGALFGINMLVNTQQGDVYSESEIRGWLEDAGFVEIKRLSDLDGAGLLTGRRPSVGWRGRKRASGRRR
jgi:cyclopropane fatty-acyl-phospholipid synthase-like methyltransferase